MKFKDSIYHKILVPDLPFVSEDLDAVKNHFQKMELWISKIPVEKKDVKYAPEKWTVAQVIGHMIDSQTVFLYRILNLARGEKAPLAPFDENIWVLTSHYEQNSINEIRSMYRTTANLTTQIISRISDSEMNNIGIANGVEISTREVILYYQAHELHHKRVIDERYLG